MAEAAALRDAAHGRLVSYSRKVFIPLTKLCRDVCHYCTFAEAPRPGRAAYLSAAGGAARSPAPAPPPAAPRRCSHWATSRSCAGARRGRRWRRWDHATTISYLVAMCGLVLKETGLLPHANPGVMTRGDIAALREVTASQGTHAGERERQALRARPGASRQPGQAPRGAARSPAAGRRAARALHHRHPDRHRRDAGGTDRGAARYRGAARPPRPHPGSHHPEFPRQAAHAGRRRRRSRTSTTCSGPSLRRASSSARR